MSNRDAIKVQNQEMPKWKVRKIREMYRQGVSINNIATALYLTRNQVTNALWSSIRER